MTADVGSGSRDAALVPLWSSVRAALPAWLIARAAVLATIPLALWAHGPDMLAEPWRGARTLQVWDAILYRALAEHGYRSYGESRFFPLLPMLVRAGHLVGLPAAPLLTALCWSAALAFAAALHRLVLLETGDEPSARRAAWLIQLVPGANVLVLGYTEALAGLLTVAFFIVLRRRRNLGWAVPVGVLCGLARPTGLLLSLPALVELARPGRDRPDRDPPDRDPPDRDPPDRDPPDRLPPDRDLPAVEPSARNGPARWLLRALVVVAPVAGTAGYLAWAWYMFGDALAPYRAQTGAELRGGVLNIDLRFLVHTEGGGYPWQLVIALLATTAVLLWLCARWLPASYTAWSLCAVAAAVTAYGFHSLPRYLASIFPLTMVAAMASGNRLVWRIVLVACLAGFTWVSYLNFIPAAVP
jgi:hypothetical protein